MVEKTIADSDIETSNFYDADDMLVDVDTNTDSASNNEYLSVKNDMFWGTLPEITTFDDIDNTNVWDVQH